MKGLDEMSYEKIFYINDDGNKVYNTKGLPENDPIRLFVEDQYCKISYKRLFDIERSYFSDVVLDYELYDWYWCPYNGYPTEMFLRDMDEKRELIKGCVDIKVNDDEYLDIKKEMEEHNIFESYTE